MHMTSHWSALTLAVGLVFIVGCASTPQKNCVTQPREPMTLRTLHSILEEQASSLDGEEGEWRLTYQGVPMALLTSLQHDRMRIIAPIVRQEEVTEQQWGKILDANFHTALDGRYATSQGIVYAAYIHPLSPLDRAQVRSALRQVVQLVKSFGTTYSSGGLQFSTPGDAAQGRTKDGTL